MTSAGTPADRMAARSTVASPIAEQGRLDDVGRVEVEVDAVRTRLALAEPAPVDELERVSIGQSPQRLERLRAVALAATAVEASQAPPDAVHIER